MSAAKSALAEADALFQSGQFVEAANRYEAIVATDTGSIPARVGLIRSYLRAGQTKQAFDSATASVAAYPDADELHVAMGEVLYRRGEMGASEKEFFRVYSKDPKNVHALLGIAKIYKAISLHRKSYLIIKLAHDLAPNDRDVQKAWMQTLSRSEKLKELEKYLATASPDDKEALERMQRQLAFLKGLQASPSRRCELVSKLDNTETDLKPLLRDPTHLRGWGLDVVINNRTSRLLLDTGASGIVISRGEAQKAGLKGISDSKAFGIGDQGGVNTHTAYADSIRVGGLEFRNCLVDVVEQRNVAEAEGLIGADVFSNYLVNIDFPGRKLKLSPLPKRPDEKTATATTLNTTGDPADDEKEDSAKPAEYVPQDRYVAPEMQNWTQVFRFGHMLLIPTRVNDSSPRLFLIDTGAFRNTLSTEFAKEVTKVSRDNFTGVKGISGRVEQVYEAKKAELAFSHLRQRNEEVVTFDLSRFSRSTGTEISGILGFNVLILLEVKIDYRDGLVEFVYDAKRTRTEYLPR